LNNYKKILYIGIAPVVGLIKLYLFSRILEAELFKNYSIFIFACTIWASLGGASGMSRLATRYVRGSFPVHNSEYLIFTIPLAGTPIAIFIPILILYYFDYPLSLDLNILLLSLSCVIMVVAIQISSIITAYYSRISNFNNIPIIGLVRNITVLIGVYFSFNEVNLIKLIFYEVLGSLFLIILAYYSLRLNLKSIYHNVIKLKKFQFSLKKINLYPFLANGLGSSIGQIDSGICLKFLTPVEYKNFYLYLLAISIGNQLNYIYSLLVSSTIKIIVNNKKKLLFLYLKNFLLMCTLTSIIIFFLLNIKYINIGFVYFADILSGINIYFLILISMALSITAFDYSSSLWLIKFGYKRFMYLLVILCGIKFLIAFMIYVFKIDNHLTFSVIFTTNLILVCFLSNLLFFRKAFSERS
jgi:hypothetical protein